MIGAKGNKRRDRKYRPEAGLLCLALVFVLIWGTAVHVHAGDEDEKTHVTIGCIVNANLAGSTTADGQKNGLIKEYLQKVSYYTGWDYEFVYGDLASIMNLSESGQVDMVAGIGKTEERTDIYLYPDYPMGTDDFYIYVHADSPLVEAGSSGLYGCTVSVEKDTAMEELLQTWNENGDYEVDIVVTSGNASRYRDFNANVTDATVDTDHAVRAADGVVPVARIGSSDYYLAVTAARRDLLDQLNAALGIIETTEAGFTDKLTEKYYPRKATSTRLLTEEEAWIDEHPVLRVGYYDAYLPFSDTDENGETIGIVTDVMKEILNQLKLTERLQLEYQGYPNAAAMTEALRQGEVDVIFPVGESLEDAEKDGIFLSSSVITTSMRLVFNGKYGESDVSRIAVKTGNRIQEEFTRQLYPQAEIVYYETMEDALDAVRNGQVGSVVINEFRKEGYLKNTRFSELNSALLPATSNRCMAVRSGNTTLLTILNRGIGSMPDNFAMTATYQYIGRLTKYTFADFASDNTLAFMLVTSAIMSVLVVLVGYLLFSRKQRLMFSRMAHRDAMTGLQNRRTFDEDCIKYSRKGREGPDPKLAVLAFDLNELKLVNDTLGHEAGEEMIIGAGICMRDVLLPYGRVYRVGGDEYMAIIHVDHEELPALLEELKKRFASWEGSVCPAMSVSMGCVTSFENPSRSFPDLKREAEKRMYEQKEKYYRDAGHDRRKH